MFALQLCFVILSLCLSFTSAQPPPPGAPPGYYLNTTWGTLYIRDNPPPSYLPLSQDNTIYIGTAQILKHVNFAGSLYIGQMLWMDKINARGGITVNGTAYNVSIVFVDISTPTSQTNAVNQALFKALWLQYMNASDIYGRIDFTAAPYSSAFTGTVAVVSETAGKICVSGGSTSLAVYTCQPNPPWNLSAPMPADCIAKGKKIGQNRFNYHVGLRGRYTVYFPTFLQAMKIKGAKSVVVLWEADEFGYTCGVASVQQATSLGMNVTAFIGLPALQTASVNTSHTSIQPAMDTIMALKPDIVLNCGFASSCSAFMLLAYDKQYTPGAYGGVNCLSQSIITNYGFKSEYYSGTFGWDSRVNGAGYAEDIASSPTNLYTSTANNTSASQYQADFLAHWSNPYGQLIASDQSASNLVAFYVIHQLLLDSNSIDNDVLVANLKLVQIPFSMFGPIQFDAFGENIGKVFGTWQILAGKKKRFNTEHSISNELAQSTNLSIEIFAPLDSATAAAFFPMPPWNSRQFENTYLKLPAEVAFIVLASACIVIVLLVMIALFVFRNKPQIKAASFVFCEIICVGAVMVFTSFYFWTVFTFTAACNIQIWLFIIGYDILMGSLLAKNIRLMYIFYYALQLKRVRPLETHHLLGLIAILIIIDSIVIIIYQAVWPIKIFTIVIDPAKPSSDYILCGSFYGADYIQTAFIATLGALKALLLLFSMIIIIATRKQASEFNESKSIAFAVYNQAFCIIALLAVWLVLPNTQYEIKYILRSIIVLWGCIMTIFFVFFRKFYYIAIGRDSAYKDKSRSSVSYGSSSNQGNSVNSFKTREKQDTDGDGDSKEPTLNLK